MGTRADFYVGKGKDAEWLGSVGWDGMPNAEKLFVLAAPHEAAYRAAVAELLAVRNDATYPTAGWPWPWDDSGTTDYAYTWDDGHAWWAYFGHTWVQYAPDRGCAGCVVADPDESYFAPPKTCVFPNMRARRNVAWGGARSGLIVVCNDGTVR